MFQSADQAAPSAPAGPVPQGPVMQDQVQQDPAWQDQATATPVWQDGMPDGGAERNLMPRDAAQAVALVRNGLDWLAAADATELTGGERAEVLRALAAAQSVHLAATARVLSAFDAAEDHAADGHGRTRTWLAWQTRVTRPAAAAQLAWARRLAACPPVAAALAAGSVSVSYARRICDWADDLPTATRGAAAEILVHAAIGGADLGDLAALAEEIRARTARPDEDDDSEERRFGRRQLFLDPYYRGNGSLRADLTPPAAAALQAVLDALGGRAGPEDERSKAQRDHDALEEACRLLIASGCLPGREGQPTQIQLHMTLTQLLGHPETSPALTASITTRGAPAPPGADCDATIVPIVTGTIDPDVLDDLVDRYLGTDPDSAHAGTGEDSTANASRADNTATNGRPATPGSNDQAPGSGRGTRRDGSETDADPRPAPAGTTAGPAAETSDQTSERARRAAAALTITTALRLLSGPAGIAARLRSHLTGPAATPSVPLDIGTATPTIPAHLRRAVIIRDQHCRFPGCDTPAARCHVHHLRHRSDGGPTSLTNCCLLCPFHHLIAIHRWRWHLTLNPDGTTTATSPDGTRVLHSHAPPTAA